MDEVRWGKTEPIVSKIRNGGTLILEIETVYSLCYVINNKTRTA